MKAIDRNDVLSEIRNLVEALPGEKARPILKLINSPAFLAQWEAGQACIDWADDDGTCHICDYDVGVEHDKECPLSLPKTSSSSECR